MRWFVAFLLLMTALATGCSSRSPEQPVSAPVVAPQPPAPAAKEAEPTGQAVAMGDLEGNGSSLTAEVMALPGHHNYRWEGILTLRVRSDAGILAEVPVTGSVAFAVDVVDFAGNGHPYLVVHTRQESISDHTGVASVFRYTAGKLTLVEIYAAWLGSTGLVREPGPVQIRVTTRQNPVTNTYTPIDFRCKPCARPIQTLLYGWDGSRLALLKKSSTRLAYDLYGVKRREFEQPLAEQAVALRNEGERLLGAGNPMEAAVRLQAALDLAPDYPDALADLALAFARQGRWADSQSAAAKAVEYNPWHPYAQFNLGLALLELGKPGEAELALRMATSLQVDRWEPHYHLGLAYERLGKLPEARREYEEALRIKPDAAAPREALSRLR